MTTALYVDDDVEGVPSGEFRIVAVFATENYEISTVKRAGSGCEGGGYLTRFILPLVPKLSILNSPLFTS